MDAEVLDMLIGEQDYTERLHKYSSKLQVQKLENPVTKVTKYYFVTNTSDETIIIICEGPKDLIKNRDNLYLTSDNKILFKLPASESCILTHNEFMWLSCKPEISFVYSNGTINTLYNEDELEGMDLYTVFSQLEFQPTSEPDTDNDNDDCDPFDDLLLDLEEDEPDDGTVQITYQGVSGADQQTQDAENQQDKDRFYYEAALDDYLSSCNPTDFGAVCVIKLFNEVVDDLLKTGRLQKLHKYSNHLHVTKLFNFKNGDIITQGYKIKNISNETVYLSGGCIGYNTFTYKMIRGDIPGEGFKFKLHANDECLLNIDEFIWLSIQPEIAFKFVNGKFRDSINARVQNDIAYELMKTHFRFFFDDDYKEPTS